MKNEKTENMNAKSFVFGTQGVPLDDFENQLEADFGKAREQKIADSVETIKTLEAQMNVSQKRKDDAEERWTLLNALHEGRTISFAKPALSMAIASILVFAEGGLLAPTMDGLNIANEWIQLIVAIAMVGALSGLLEISVHNFHKTPRRLWLVVAPAAFSITTLAIFGWWRGEEVIFAGKQDGGSTFASENALLTRVLLMLVTIALPITAAFFLDFGLKGLRFFRERLNARSDFQKFTREVDENQKKLEAAHEKRVAELEKIEQDRESWLGSARDSWEHGRITGAWKLPFWQAVVMPTAIVGILIFVIVMIAGMVLIDPVLAQFIESDLFRVALFVLLSIGLTGLFAMHFIRKWNRPTAEEIFKHPATHWQNAENPNSLRLLEAEKKRPSVIGKADDEWETKTIVAAN